MLACLANSDCICSNPPADHFRSPTYRQCFPYHTLRSTALEERFGRVVLGDAMKALAERKELCLHSDIQSLQTKCKVMKQCLLIDP